MVLKREEFPFPNHDNTSHLTANIYTFSVEELFQAPWFNWILSSDVKELVFSFHYSDVIIGNYCCSGTENVFFVHYRYSLGTFGCTYIDKTTFHTFPSYYNHFWQYWSSCWSQDIWEVTCLIQQLITSLLCRSGQNQGTNPSGHKKMCISVGVMHYLQGWLAS